MLESGGNVLAIFAHGGALLRTGSPLTDTICESLKASVQFGMTIWHRGPRIILDLLLSSTADRFYFSQIVDRTGLARGTVSSVLQRLEAAGIVDREEERFKSESTFRGARVYYSLDPRSFHHVRLQAPST